MKNEGECFMRIIIYGAGDMGVEASKVLIKSNAEVTSFIDKDPEKQGKFINGIKVINIYDISEDEKENSIIAVGVVKFSYNDIKEELEKVGCKNIMYVGDLINQVYVGPSIANVWSLNNITEDEREKLNFINEMYADDSSRHANEQIVKWLKYRVEDVKKDAMCDFNEKYFIDKVKKVLRKDEIFVDCGAYIGGTISNIQKNAQYKAIYAFEPDNTNYSKLIRFIDQNQDKEKIFAYNFGLGDADCKKNFTSDLGMTARYSDEYGTELRDMHKLDTVMKSIPYTFLKIYGISNGLNILKGGVKTIKDNRPIVTINIHHSRNNFIEIPFFIMKNFGNYNFYLRLHCYCGSDAVIYAIPKEREYES